MKREHMTLRRLPASESVIDCFEDSRGRCLDSEPAYCMRKCRHNLLEERDYEDGAAPPFTCVLKLASYGPFTLEEIGLILGVTRERVRQIEATTLRKMQRKTLIRMLAERKTAEDETIEPPSREEKRKARYKGRFHNV